MKSPIYEVISIDCTIVRILFDSITRIINQQRLGSPPLEGGQLHGMVTTAQCDPSGNDEPNNDWGLRNSRLDMLTCHYFH